MVEINQISNNNQINHSRFSARDQNLENKVKSIISQLPGKIRNINFKYNSQSISKAKITIVVSSKAEAEKVRQNNDDEIDIKVIIREEIKKEETSEDSVQNLQEDTIKGNEDSKDYSANIYSYNRGPDGKIYGIIKEEKDNPTDAYISPLADRDINNNLREKYINIYKRYNFKNIIIQENQHNNNFSLNI